MGQNETAGKTAWNPLQCRSISGRHLWAGQAGLPWKGEGVLVLSQDATVRLLCEPRSVSGWMPLLESVRTAHVGQTCTCCSRCGSSTDQNSWMVRPNPDTAFEESKDFLGSAEMRISPCAPEITQWMKLFADPVEADISKGKRLHFSPN